MGKQRGTKKATQKSTKSSKSTKKSKSATSAKKSKSAKSAKKSKSSKTTPKKAAPKKAAPKKAAPKKAKAAKAPASKKPPKESAKPATEAAEMEQADLMVMDGMNVPDKATRAKNVAESAASPNYDAARKAILDLFRSFFPQPGETDEQILATDPNDFDMDPSPFYETLSERFGLEDDPNEDYFGGFGGKIEHTIAVVAKRWDGKLRG